MSGERGHIISRKRKSEYKNDDTYFLWAEIGIKIPLNDAADIRGLNVLAYDGQKQGISSKLHRS